MKTIIAIVLIAQLLFNTVWCQDSKIVSLMYPTLEVKPDTVYTIDDEFRNLLAQTSSTSKLLISIKKIPFTGKSWNCGEATESIRADSSIVFNITDKIRNRMTNEDFAEFKVKDEVGNPVAAITVKWNQISTLMPKDEDDVEDRIKIINSFRSNNSFKNPYDIKKNRVDLFFNENGRLLNYLPVNTDQNDIFDLHIICESRNKENYRINVIEGIYAPVDLSIRPYEEVMRPHGTFEEVEKAYEVVDLQQGPFTTENFTFQVSFDSLNGHVFNGPAYNLKINKLYHVGMGVSIINTYLENPDFRIAPLDSTTNTIESYNTGARTLFTINAIWYWSVLHQNIKGSVITSGRDILKDEPTFSLTRVFPTVGVSLDNDFNENFFLGILYEFARGGSLIAGIHYGRVKELSDKDFEENMTPFFGTDEDIRINNVYKPAFFFGINIDTRIFNALFK